MEYLPLISTTTVSFLSDIFTSWWGHKLAIKRDQRRESQHRRRMFHDYIAVLHKTFSPEVTKGSDLVSVHEKSRTEFRSRCVSVEREIYDTHRDMFITSRDAYLAIPLQDIECRDETQKATIKNDFGNFQSKPYYKPPPNYELGRTNIRTLLETLIECSK